MLRQSAAAADCVIIATVSCVLHEDEWRVGNVRHVDVAAQ
jgi:hypothetical protein